MSRAGRGSLTKSKRRTVWNRDGGRCHYCHTELPLGPDCTLDHVWPKALGGSHANDNLVAACKPCNEARGEDTDKCRCDFCTAAMKAGAASPRPPVPRIHRGKGSIASLAEIAGFAWTSDGWKAADCLTDSEETA